MASAGLFGLLWGRVAYLDGSIGRSLISHVLLDFSGLSARIYFEDGRPDDRWEAFRLAIHRSA